jgi:hypothetical protein
MSTPPEGGFRPPGRLRHRSGTVKERASFMRVAPPPCWRMKGGKGPPWRRRIARLVASRPVRLTRQAPFAWRGNPAAGRLDRPAWAGRRTRTAARRCGHVAHNAARSQEVPADQRLVQGRLPWRRTRVTAATSWASCALGMRRGGNRHARMLPVGLNASVRQLYRCRQHFPHASWTCLAGGAIAGCPNVVRAAKAHPVHDASAGMSPARCPERAQAPSFPRISGVPP